MGQRSSIRRLPEAVRLRIEAMVSEDALTLGEMIARLQAEFPEEAATGTLPSRSALHRYGQRLQRRLNAIRASTEAAHIIRREIADREDSRSEALTAMIQSELFEVLMDLQSATGEDGEPLDVQQRLKLLSSAGQSIAQLSRSSVSLKQFQSQVQEATRQKLLAQQKAALSQIERKPGITPATMAHIRRALGIDAPEDAAPADAAPADDAAPAVQVLP